MDINAQKEQFSIAYMRAIAAHAGIKSSRDEVDDDSIDLRLSSKGYCGEGVIIRSPIVELQVKCTSQKLISGDVIKFKVPKKNYNDLRGSDFVCPRYLVVVLVPDETDEWAVFSEDGMKLAHHCYWVSLRDFPETNNSSKISVDIPLEQRITTETLLDFMKMASRGESV